MEFPNNPWQIPETIREEMYVFCNFFIEGISEGSLGEISSIIQGIISKETSGEVSEGSHCTFSDHIPGILSKRNYGEI